VSNLLDNAFKYVVTRASAQGAGTAGPGSGFHVTLRVYSLDAGQLGGAAAGAEETLGAVLVEVQDDGPGVTEEELRRLGERGCVEAQMILALDACWMVLDACWMVV
jgi:signal transduction histidine kinase